MTIPRTTLMAGLLTAAAFASAPASADEAKPIALLASHFQNDHEAYEPTNDAERTRMTNIMRVFRAKLEESGKYRFVAVSPEVQSRIDKDQKMGECGGCESRYGAEVGAKEVAWIEVQKVSNLILNINVYMKDVNEDKPSFVKSVDVRGNTDETWDHSMKYLIKHYLVQPKA